MSRCGDFPWQPFHRLIQSWLLIIPCRIGRGGVEACRKYRSRRDAVGEDRSRPALGLRDVIAGHLPDQERVIYLRFLLGALDQIRNDVPPDKAVGIWTNNAPKRVDPWRDTGLFLHVGQELDRIRSLVNHDEAPVRAAIKAVASRRKSSVDTVKDAWEKNGAMNGRTALQEMKGE